LYATSLLGKQQLLEASSKLRLEIPFGPSSSTGIFSCRVSLKELQQRSTTTPLQRGLATLHEIRQKSLTSSRESIDNLLTRWTELPDAFTREDMEGFYIYALSMATSLVQSPHKVADTIARILTDMTTRLASIIQPSQRTDWVPKVRNLLSSEWWQLLKESLRLSEEETF